MKAQFSYKKDFALLVGRVGIGIMFMLHGWPKLAGGAERWESLGRSMATLGIDFWAPFWGFMAAFAEFFGGLFLALGAATPLFSFLLLFTMFVASTKQLFGGSGIMGASHAIEAGVIFLFFLLHGPGKLSVDTWISRKTNGYFPFLSPE